MINTRMGVFKVNGHATTKCSFWGKSMEVDLRFLNAIHFSAPSWGEEEKSDGHFELDAVARRSNSHSLVL